jgi:hypothetical protein
MAVGQDRVGQWPEVLGRLQLGRVGWQEQEVDVLGDPQAGAGVPPRPVEHEDDLLGRPGAHRAGERLQLGLEQADAHRGGEMEDGAARGGVDEADQVAPRVAVLDRRQWALPVEAPHRVQDGFQADAVLVDRPELDLRLGEGGRDLAQERSQFFLNASCAAGSARTCRGRGVRRLPSRRTR